jgi:guanine deaminase
MKRYSELILESEETRQLYFMNKAIETALNNIKNGGGPFASIIVKNDKIISVGVNRVTLDNDPTAHAEVVAIREACKRLQTFQLGGCELYSTCEPCPMCLSSIYWAKIDKVYYGANRMDAKRAEFADMFIYNEIKKKPELRQIPFIQINQHDALKIFRDWKEKEDKITY